MPITFKPFDWYATPLYYDIIFDADTPTEADFLNAVWDRYVTSGKRRVLEPACGTGRLLRVLHERGYTCTGFDLSDGMLAYAKPRCPGVRFFEAAMQDFSVRGRFDLAFNLVSTFKYLLAEADARAHLSRMADVLSPGGVYVLGLHLSDYDETSRNRERWVAERDGVHVVCNIQGWPPDAKARREKVRSRMIVTEGGRTERYETSWAFRTYDLKQLRSLLRSEPRLEHVSTFGFDHRIDRPHDLEDDYLDQFLILRRV